MKKDGNEIKRLLKVIVADDEVELCDAICQLIHWNEIGFELVGSAQNGLEALRLAEQLEPDLLLTDIRMPFISGIELARQVREMSPMTSIAFISGYDDFTYAQKAIRYDVMEYLLKPSVRQSLPQNWFGFGSGSSRDMAICSFADPMMMWARWNGCHCFSTAMPMRSG